MTKNIKFGILIATKNAYSMVEEWISLYDYCGFSILNLDLNSDKELRLKGKDICKKHGIVFRDCNSTEMQDNINQALQYFYEEKGIEWVLYMHHDAYPMLKNTLTQLNDILLNSSKIKEFGVIGFNIYHDQFDLSQFDANKHQLMTTARSPLELGNGYYNGRVESRVDYKKFEFRPFAVESVMWSTALINYHQFNKYITIDTEFNFFHSWDDVAFQFLSNNIYNIVIPSLSFGHDQSLKVKHKLPISSPNGDKKKVEKHYGRFDHILIWKDKWGFDYSLSKCLFGGDSFINKGGRINKIITVASKFTQYDFASSLETVARKSYRKQYGINKNLLNDFYDHDPKNGPLKYFDI
jgi:hypothetical protein